MRCRFFSSFPPLLAETASLSLQRNLILVRYCCSTRGTRSRPTRRCRGPCARARCSRPCWPPVSSASPASGRGRATGRAWPRTSPGRSRRGFVVLSCSFSRLFSWGRRRRRRSFSRRTLRRSRFSARRRRRRSSRRTSRRSRFSALPGRLAPACSPLLACPRARRSRELPPSECSSGCW